MAPSKIARRLRRVESGIKNKAREIGLPAKFQQQPRTRSTP